MTTASRTGDSYRLELVVSGEDGLVHDEDR